MLQSLKLPKVKPELLSAASRSSIVNDRRFASTDAPGCAQVAATACACVIQRVRSRRPQQAGIAESPMVMRHLKGWAGAAQCILNVPHGERLI